MTHLAPDERVAAAEGDARHAAHLAACRSCRAEVQALASLLREAASVEVPEPSPFFWEHFHARVSAAAVREAAEAGARRAGRGRSRWFALRLLLPAAAALVVLVVAGRLLLPVTPAPRSRVPSSTGAPVAATSAEPDAAGEEESWRVFSALASEAEPGGTLASPGPGAADGAVLQLTDDERGELIRLLKAELAGQDVRTEG
jgi:hypothetical protein